MVRVCLCVCVAPPMLHADQELSCSIVGVKASEGKVRNEAGRSGIGLKDEEVCLQEGSLSMVRQSRRLVNGNFFFFLLFLFVVFFVLVSRPCLVVVG